MLLKGVARLSQLEVDTGKDWEAKEITNLRSVAIAMAHGDIAFRGVSIMEKLAADAGKGYSFLRSRGPGLAPVWQDIESLVQYMTGAVNRAADGRSRGVSLESKLPRGHRFERSESGRSCDLTRR